MPQQENIHQQAQFGGGVNAQFPPHIIGADEVQTATNIDFSLERGALSVRRGSISVAAVSTNTTSNVTSVFRNYLNNNIDASPFYFSDSAGTIYKGTFGGSYTRIVLGGNSVNTGFAAIRNYTYIASGPAYYKDDGTNVTNWLKNPPNQPIITINTLSALSVGTVWVETEGLGSSTFTGTATGTVNATTYRAAFTLGTSSVNLNLNGTNTIGTSGIVYCDLAFSNPSDIVEVDIDFSIGDTTFENFWHGQFLSQGDSILTTNTTLANLQASLQSGSQGTLGTLRTQYLSPLLEISQGANVFAPLGIAKPNFQIIGDFDNSTGVDPWTQIYAARIVVVTGTDTTQQVMCRNFNIQGANNFPLNDIQNGYVWYQTWATIDSNGFVTGESPPSPPTARMQMQQAQVVVVQSGLPSPTAAITHLITYRQGGYIGAPYGVSSNTANYLGTNTFTDTQDDITTLENNIPLQTINCYAGSQFPGDVNVVAKNAFFDRAVVAHDNIIMWSLPGRADVFPFLSNSIVSYTGDNVMGVIIWMPGAVIVNRDSVYEWYGNVFEGTGQDWTLYKTGSRKGSIAQNVVIRTPYGIPLLDYDGLSMYVLGQGIDTPLSWAMEQLGDAWRGNGTGDPAAIKGNRIPAINFSYINQSSAAFGDGKLYMAVPTGTSSLANTVFVMDFRVKKSWWYQYPFNIGAMWWDEVNSRIIIGSTAPPYMLQIETGSTDGLQGTNGLGIGWSVKTRAWTTPSDTLTENNAIEFVGGPVVVNAIYDATNTTLLGTFSATNKAYTIPTMGGTYGNNLVVQMQGTSSGYTSVYGLSWDAFQEPPKVAYFRTEFDNHNYEGDKLWQVQYYTLSIIGTGTVTAVTYIDNVATNTQTFSSTQTSQEIYARSFPAETYGEVAYTTYTGSGCVFKHWTTTYQALNEPPRINYWKSQVQSLDENICDAFDVDINPNGTVIGVCLLDNVPISTNIIIGTLRQSYTHSVPIEQYGRTIYATYTGSNFKHYQTWFHLRAEPDRWNQFVTDREDNEEHEWKIWNCIANPLGQTVLSTLFIDGISISTYTLTGSLRETYQFSIPPATYGRTYWTVHEVNGTGVFKHYKTWCDGVKEPAKLVSWREGPIPFPSEHYLKTWLPTLDCLNGTTFGTLLANNNLLMVGTFTGTKRQTYEVGLDDLIQPLLSTASTLEVIYYAQGANLLKHYSTQFETDPKPFHKLTWAFAFKKLGGASQVDLARYYSIDIEPVGTATITQVWDMDELQAVATNVFVVNTRTFIDRIPVGPGLRGKLFQSRLYASVPIRVYDINLDVHQIGIKGFIRQGVKGTPVSHPYSAFSFSGGQ